jgi:hypothetical protein
MDAKGKGCIINRRAGQKILFPWSVMVRSTVNDLARKAVKARFCCFLFLLGEILA